jgi:peptidoglycan-N-acetylglucosamine deacetylase
MLHRILTPKLAAELAAGAAIAAGSYVLANAALRPASQLFGRTLIAGPDPAEAALTYDDGPNDAATNALLDLLALTNTRATFFMIGRFVRQRPELARRVHAAGHLIGNHTETHPWLHLHSARVIREELCACNQALEDALGAPVRYFRPPHGARRPAVMRLARELGLTTVQWNVIGKDWKPLAAAQILANITQGIARTHRRGGGANILLHDGSDRAMDADRRATVSVTADLLARFQRDRIRTVTVDAWG